MVMRAVWPYAPASNASASTKAAEAVLRLLSKVDCREAIDVGFPNTAVRSALEDGGIRFVRPSRAGDPLYEGNDIGREVLNTGGLTIAARLAAELDRSNVFVICLDALHRVDTEGLAEALGALRRLTQCLAVISIDLGPVNDPRAHGTLLPRATWIRLLEAAGFAEVAGAVFEDVSANSPSSELRDHWLCHPPFFDSSATAHEVILLQARAEPTLAELRESIDAYLDLAYLRLKRTDWSVPDDRLFILNLHHVQDYFFFRPLLDVMDPARVVAVSREGNFFPSLQMEAARGRIERMGIRVLRYRRCADLPWAELRGGHLISASEGTFTFNQCLSLQVVAAAQVNGCATTLLQHGIIAESFPNRFYCYGSEAIVTWGEEALSGLADRSHAVFGQPLPWGVNDTKTQYRLGSPKYTDILLPGATDFVRDRFGVPETRFSSVTLVGAKSRRGFEADPRQFSNQLRNLAKARPDDLFIVKTHPSNNASALEDLRCDNLILLDDVHCIIGDISLPRLLRSVDVVASSLSTLLLDGAIASKPIFLYETKHALNYYHLQAKPLEQLADRPIYFDEHAMQKFRMHYASAVDATFYAKFSAYLSQNDDHPKLNASLASILSLATTVEDETLRVEEAQQALQEAQRAVQDTHVREIKWMNEAIECEARGQVQQENFAQAQSREREWMVEAKRVSAEWSSLRASNIELQEQCDAYKRSELPLQREVDDLRRVERGLRGEVELLTTRLSAAEFDLKVFNCSLSGCAHKAQKRLRQIVSAIFSRIL